MQARGAAGTDLGEGALGEDAAEKRVSRHSQHTWAAAGGGRVFAGDLHEQASLSAGAVTDNNELASDLGHGAGRREVCGMSGGRVGSCVRRAELAGGDGEGWVKLDGYGVS